MSSMPLAGGRLITHGAVVDQLFSNGASRDSTLNAAFAAIDQFVGTQAGRSYAAAGTEVCTFLHSLK